MDIGSAALLIVFIAQSRNEQIDAGCAQRVVAADTANGGIGNKIGTSRAGLVSEVDFFKAPLRRSSTQSHGPFLPDC